MTSEKTIKRIQTDLLTMSMKLDTLITCVEKDAGKRILNKLTRLLEATREIANSVTPNLVTSIDVAIDVARGISSGLEESDAQEFKSPTGGTDFAFYFMIKGKRCE